MTTGCSARPGAAAVEALRSSLCAEVLKLAYSVSKFSDDLRFTGRGPPAVPGNYASQADLPIIRSQIFEKMLSSTPGRSAIGSLDRRRSFDPPFLASRESDMYRNKECGRVYPLLFLTMNLHSREPMSSVL